MKMGIMRMFIDIRAREREEKEQGAAMSWPAGSKPDLGSTAPGLGDRIRKWQTLNRSLFGFSL